MKGGVVPNKFNIDISGVLNKKMKTGIADLRGSVHSIIEP